jgi:hypothetical protein
MSIKLIISVFLIFSLALSEPIFKPYPLANDYFDIIYDIKGTFNQRNIASAPRTMFLRVFCK